MPITTAEAPPRMIRPSLVPIFGMAPLLARQRLHRRAVLPGIGIALGRSAARCGLGRLRCSIGCPARIKALLALALVSRRRTVAHPRSVRPEPSLRGHSSRRRPRGRRSAASIAPIARPGFYPLLAIMLLSLPALPRAATSLEFFFIWELITLSSYFLILQRREAAPHALRYLLFSLAAAFFLLVGFAMMPCRERDACRSPRLRDGGPGQRAGLRPARDRPPDQGRRDRRACLAAGRLCGSRRRRVRHAVGRRQQGRDLRTAGRHLCRDPLGGRPRTRACCSAGSAC